MTQASPRSTDASWSNIVYCDLDIRPRFYSNSPLDLLVSYSFIYFLFIYFNLFHKINFWCDVSQAIKNFLLITSWRQKYLKTKDDDP